MTGAIWAEVAAERERAHRKHGETSMEAQPVDALLRLAILMEEVGEVAKEFNEARHNGMFDLAALRKELVQVAAMAGRLGRRDRTAAMTAWAFTAGTTVTVSTTWTFSEPDRPLLREGTPHSPKMPMRDFRASHVKVICDQDGDVKRAQMVVDGELRTVAERLRS